MAHSIPTWTDWCASSKAGEACGLFLGMGAIRLNRALATPRNSCVMICQIVLHHAVVHVVKLVVTARYRAPLALNRPCELCLVRSFPLSVHLSFILIFRLPRPSAIFVRSPGTSVLITNHHTACK